MDFLYGPLTVTERGQTPSGTLFCMQKMLGMGVGAPGRAHRKPGQPPRTTPKMRKTPGIPARQPPCRRDNPLSWGLSWGVVAGHPPFRALSWRLSQHLFFVCTSLHPLFHTSVAMARYFTKAMQEKEARQKKKEARQKKTKPKSKHQVQAQVQAAPAVAIEPVARRARPAPYAPPAHLLYTPTPSSTCAPEPPPAYHGWHWRPPYGTFRY